MVPLGWWFSFPGVLGAASLARTSFGSFTTVRWKHQVTLNPTPRVLGPFYATQHSAKHYLWATHSTHTFSCLIVGELVI